MYKIQANTSGTRSIAINDAYLEVIRKYALFKGLVDSTGIVNEETLDRLKLNVRSLLESEKGNNKELLDLCLDVVYNTDMKALGLNNLVKLYKEWCKQHPTPAREEEQTPTTE